MPLAAYLHTSTCLNPDVTHKQMKLIYITYLLVVNREETDIKIDAERKTEKNVHENITIIIIFRIFIWSRQEN